MFIIVYAVLYLVQILKPLLAKLNILVPHWLFPYMPKPGAMLSPRAHCSCLCPMGRTHYISGLSRNKQKKKRCCFTPVVI